jgi:hypothetical protein
MATQPGTLEQILGEIGPILARVEHRLAPENVLGTFAELGLQLPDALLSDAPLVTSLTTACAAGAAILDRLETLAGALESDDTLAVVQAAIALVQQLGALFTAVDDVASRLEAAATAIGMGSADVAQFALELPLLLVEELAIERLESPGAVANVLQLLGVVERTLVPAVPGDPTHPEFERRRLHLRNLIDFVRSPSAHFAALYDWGSATFDGQRLFAVLEDIAARAGLPVTLVPATATDPLTLRIVAFELQPDTSVSPPGLKFLLSAPVEADIDTTVALGHDAWTLQVTTNGLFDAGLTGFIRPPLDIALLPPNGSLDGQLLAKIVGELADATARFVLLGVAGASRIEARHIEASLGMRFAWDGTHAIGETVTEARIDDARAVLDTSEGDGFLKDVLGGGKGDAAFSVRAFWSAGTGFRFEGSSAIELALPVHASLGPIEITSVVIAAAPGDGAVPVEVSGNFRGQLGPLQFVVERLGIELQATTPDRGNLGPLDLDAAFKAPTGIGLSIDGGGFKGGGFLGYEPQAKRYSGMLELEFQGQFSLKAFGLIETQLPDGAAGYSLVIVISSEFTPVQLGFGFTLNGVGGLLGLNRTVNVQRLASGIRDQTLSSILFPTDIVANADRILSDLRQVFPAQRGRFVFGPLAKLGWGTPALLTADLGLVLEVPEPVRLILLGVVRGILPDEKAAILRLQVNFVGVIDFAQERFSFDATLYDSKLLSFALSGDMAMRLYWGAEANFLTTVGGFHPAFQPPPMNLPALRRITLALVSGENPRLTLETYFAVTSNTAQFGARLELYAAAWKFNAYGFLSFDVLLQFNPFYFVADVTAMLALRVGSASIAGIKVTLKLEGPTPWKAQGDARLKLCWFLTVKIHFSKTFGEVRNTTLPDLAVLPLVVAALGARDNWSEQRPADQHRLESLRALPAGAAEPVRVHPVGTVAISQKVVPLGTAIDRIGAQRPADARSFAIDTVVVGGEAQGTPAAVQESFAPAQYFDLSDADKLASPSFKQFDSGIRVGNAARMRTGYAAAREVKYEIKYIDATRATAQPQGGGRFDMDAVAFGTWVIQGATAQSDLSFASRRKSALAPAAVDVIQEPFVVVFADSLAAFDDASVMDSERAALARADALVATYPALRGSLHVVPLFEMSA